MYYFRTLFSFELYAINNTYLGIINQFTSLETTIIGFK